MGRYKIGFFAKERNNPLDRERLGRIVDLILRSPFGDYEVMCLDIDEYEFVPFDDRMLLAELERRRYFSIILGSGITEEELEGTLHVTLTSTEKSNNFVLLVDHEDFLSSGDVDRFYDFVREIAKLFTKISEGVTRAIAYDDEEYYDKHGLEHLDSCFSSYVAWVHILGADQYTLDGYSKEDLLNAPAYKVEEWENDTIFMMSYKDPFSWDEEQTIEQIKRLNSYLLEKAEDIQW